MTYEIPQNLKYNERIIFNLTIEQTGYALGFGLVAVLIVAKTPYSLAVRAVLSAIPLSIGLAFMYLPIWAWLRNLNAYRKFRKAGLFDKKMKQYLGLLAVENAGHYTIKTKQGKQNVAVLRVDPLNFKIKPKEERESILYNFRKLLNALDFPIQIAMYTDDLNLNSYLTDLNAKASSNPVHAELVKAHKTHLQKIMKERLTLNRTFLIAIRENHIGLKTQVSIVEGFLKNVGLHSTRLKGRALIRILIRFFNNPNDRKEIIKKEKNIYTITHPKEIANAPDHIKVNNHLNRIIAASGYPRTVEEGFLDKIITTAGNFDLSIHIEPYPLDTTLTMLNRELQKQRADLFAAEKKGIFHPSLEIQCADTKAVLDSIQKGQEKLFNVSLYINVKAKKPEELNALTKAIQSQLSSILIVPEVPKYRMAQGLKSILPFGLNELGIRRNITTYALSAFFPFTSPFLILEKGGVFLGLNKNKLPIIKDIFNLSNANGAILATSGSGKSYTAKLLISRYLTTGTRVIVIDPQNEYVKLTEQYGGSVVTISKDSETIINPLDLLGNEYSDKRLALLDLFNIMFGQLNESQRAVLDKAITQTYLDAGITSDDYAGKTPPILGDLHKTLLKLSKDAGMYEKGTYVMLLNRLSMYVDGAFSFLNRQTQIDVNNQFVTFNIGSMPKQVKPVMMFLVLDYVYSCMKRDRARKLLVIDEAWSMLQHAQEEGYIFEIVKTCRKWNLGLLLITQDVADLLNGKAGRAVLSNSAYTILLRQKSAVIGMMEGVFNLSIAEREHLLTAEVGQGLLMMENDHQELRIIASPQEHNLITTKPDEMVETDPDIPADVPLNAQKLIKELNLECDVYKSSNLHPVQDDYLRRKDYKVGNHMHPYARAYAKYHVKPRGKESQDHIFLAWTVYEELLNYTSKAKRIYSTKSDLNPDIIFTNEAGQEIAVEIETGTNYKFNPDYLQKKIENLNKQYPNCWCVFLTTNQYKPRYENLCKAPVMLRRQLGRFLKKQFPNAARVRSYTTPIYHTQNIDDKKEQNRDPAKSYGRTDTPQNKVIEL